MGRARSEGGSLCLVQFITSRSSTAQPASLNAGEIPRSIAGNNYSSQTIIPKSHSQLRWTIQPDSSKLSCWCARPESATCSFARDHMHECPCLNSSSTRSRHQPADWPTPVPCAADAARRWQPAQGDAVFFSLRLSYRLDSRLRSVAGNLRCSYGAQSYSKQEQQQPAFVGLTASSSITCEQHYQTSRSSSAGTFTSLAALRIVFPNRFSLNYEI